MIQVHGREGLVALAHSPAMQLRGCRVDFVAETQDGSYWVSEMGFE